MENTEEKIKRRKEIGLREYALWKQGALRGHRMIGQYIINRYGLLPEDFKPRDLRRSAMYNKRSRAKKNKLKKNYKEEIKNEW